MSKKRICMLSVGMVLIGFFLRGLVDCALDEIIERGFVLATLSSILATISFLLIIGWLLMAILEKRKMSTILKISGFTLIIVALAIRIAVAFVF